MLQNLYLHQHHHHRRRRHCCRYSCGGHPSRHHYWYRPPAVIIIIRGGRCHILASTCRMLLMTILLLLVTVFNGYYCLAQPLRRGASSKADEQQTALNQTTTTNNNDIVIDTAHLIYPLHAMSGTLHVDIWIGQPAVLQTLIVDTGSRFTATPCQEDCTITAACGNIGHAHHRPHAPLNESSASLRRTLHCPHCRLAESCSRRSPSPSSTTGGSSSSTAGGIAGRFIEQQCILQQAYTEGSSWTATEVNDMVALAGESSSLFTAAAVASSLFANDTKQQHSVVNNNNNIKHQQQVDDLNHALAFSFGCQFQVKGLFAQQYANGILGLQRSRHSIVESMTRQGILQHASFSLCIAATADADHSSSSSRSTGSGSSSSSWLGLGGALTKLHLSDMKFTYMPNNISSSSTTTSTTTTSTAHTAGYFQVYVEQVWLGHDEYDKVLVASIETTPEIMKLGFQTGKGTILDSGTTDTYLPYIMRTAMERAWLNYTTTNSNNGSELLFEYSERQRSYMYTYDEFQRYIPPIHLVLYNNVVLTLDPHNYMEGARNSNNNHNHNNANNNGNRIPWEGRRKLTNRVYVDEPMGAVLGLNAMMGHDIYFENKWTTTTTTDNNNRSSGTHRSQQQHRIGIAPANCAMMTTAAATSTTTTSQT